VRNQAHKDIGADSVNDSYPYFVHLSDYIRQNGFPSWSFCVGMGQSLYYLIGDLVWKPVVWLPREWIAHALVYQHLAKTLIAGLLFFGFLRTRGLNLRSCWLGAALLVFSSYMCMGSCWVINADEVVGFAFLLFATEAALSRGIWIYLPFATALLGIVTVFHFYLGALLLCSYLGARFLEQRIDRQSSNPLVLIGILAAAALGVGLAAIFWLPSVQSILNSPRGSGLIPNFAFGVAPFKFFNSIRHSITSRPR
jgi:Bacterial membrane protein YfhO